MKTSKKVKETTNQNHRPATNPEAQKNLCINLAMNLAEKQLRDGTASSQVITQFLKMETERERNELENEKLKLELELVQAKTENLKSNQRAEEAYVKVIESMKLYSGIADDEYDEEE